MPILSPGGEAVDAITAELQRQAVARQQAFLNQRMTSQDTLANARENRLVQSEADDLKIRQMEAEARIAQAKRNDEDRDASAWEKKLATMVEGDVLTDPGDIKNAQRFGTGGRQIHVAQTPQAPTPVPTPQGIPESGAQSFVPTPPQTVLRMGRSSAQRLQDQQVAQSLATLDAELPKDDPRRGAIDDYVKLNPGKPVPEDLIHPKPDQPVYGYNGRTGKVELQGTVPGNAVVRNEQFAPQGPAAPNPAPVVTYDDNGKMHMYQVVGNVAHEVTGLPEGTTKVNPVNSTMQTRMDFAKKVESHMPDIRHMVGQAEAMGVLGPITGRWNEFLAGKVGSTGDPVKDEFLAQFRSELSFLKSGMGVVHSGARGGAVEIVKRFDSILNSDKMSPAELKGALAGFDDWLKTYASNPATFKDTGGGGGTTPPPSKGMTPAEIQKLKDELLGPKKGG